VAGKKAMPVLRRRGRRRKNARDGITSQNIPWDREMTFPVSFVSRYSQMRAMRETRGSEAIKLARKELFLPSLK
jgi:hypothetical protein